MLYQKFLCSIWGGKPLHAASRGGHPDVAQLLLGAGADLEAEDNGGPCDNAWKWQGTYCIYIYSWWFILIYHIWCLYNISYHESVYITGLNILEIWRFFAFRIFCQFHHPLYHIFILDLCNILEIWFYTHVFGWNQNLTFLAHVIIILCHLTQLLSINVPLMLASRQVGRLCSLLRPMGRFHLFRCCWMLEPRWMRRMTTVPGPKSQYVDDFCSYSSVVHVSFLLRSTLLLLDFHLHSCFRTTGCSMRQSFNPNRISNFESSCFPLDTDQ